MMGWQTGDQRQLFYLFNLERRIPGVPAWLPLLRLVTTAARFNAGHAQRIKRGGQSHLPPIVFRPAEADVMVRGHCWGLWSQYQ
jgi:hypothetical protein